MELMTEEKKKFQRTEIGLIPSEWSFEEIGPKIDLLSGNPFSSSGYSDHGVRLLRGANIKRGNTQWDDDNTKFWPKNDPSLKKYKLKPDDLVIAMDGSLVGRSYAFLSEQDVPSFLLQRVARIRSDKIDTKYLKYFIGSSWFVDYCDSVKTNTAIPHISSTDIKNFKIPLPPTLEEQQAIASALSDVDELIRSLDGLIQKKQAIKKGTMQQLLSGNKRLPGFDGEWEVKKLGELAENISSGKSNTKSNVGKYPIYGSTGIIGRSSSYDYRGDKILVARVGANAGTVNQVNGEYNVSDNTLMINLKTSVSIDFVRYFLVEYDLGTLIFGSGQPLITGGQLKKLDICIPDLEYQNKIVEILSDMDRELQTLRQKREKYVQIKQGMMQELLTGKTRLV